MPGNTAIVIGATGQVGSLLVDHLLKDSFFDQVRVVVRRYYSVVHPKLENRLVNFRDLPSLKATLGTGHTLFCCVGTTMKLVKGDKTLYREIDLEIPVHSSQAAYENGVRRCMLISAVGADPLSKNFYLRLKGEVEQQLQAIPFNSLYIMRPSLLLGHREESRVGEGVAKALMKPISKVFTGKLQRYRPIEASEVALAMLGAAREGEPGVHICHYPEMQALVKRLLTGNYGTSDDSADRSKDGAPNGSQ